MTFEASWPSACKAAVYAYGNGAHNGPYKQRDFDYSFPLILEALGL
jgi:hypothetical protein